MKKLVPLICSFLYTTLAFAQNTGWQAPGSERSLVYKLLATRHDVWSSGNWLYNDSANYIYNGQGLNTEDSTYTYNSPDWNNSVKHFYTYAGGSHVANDTFQYWVSNQWRNYKLTMNTYDGNFNKTSTEVLNWDTIGVWVNYTKTSASFDANNNILVTAALYWNAVNSTWDSSYYSSNSYDGNNNVLAAITETWSGGVPSIDKSVYKYDGNNYRIQQYQLQWNGSGWDSTGRQDFFYDAANNDTLDISYNQISGWIPAQSDSSVYNINHQKTFAIYKNWDTDSLRYINSIMQVFAYDQANNQTLYKSYYWNTTVVTNNRWVAGYEYDYTYDANENMVYSLNKYDSVNTDQSFLYYTSFNIIGITALSNELSAVVFPNPALENTNLQIEIPAPGNLHMALYDATGRVVTEENRQVSEGTNRISINLQGISRGTYLLRAIDLKSGRTAAVKLLKE